MNDYLINYQADSVDNLKRIIHKSKGLPLCSMRISDLILFQGKPIYRGCGVYIFKLNDKVHYVGSCVSRSFIERIPSHLDIRQVGWFNSLLKSILKLEGKVISDENLHLAARFALSNISVILINFEKEHEREAITRLEHELIIYFETKNKKPSLKRFEIR